MQDSEAIDQALTTRAKREQEEVAVQRARFELTRDKIIFGFELVLAAIATVAMVTVLVMSPALSLIALLGGGGIGVLTAVFRRRSGDA